MLYWAYGSNLNINQMRRRCPKARMRGPLIVNDAALVFRGVADVTVREGSQVQGGLWLITRECEEELDRYEGVSSGFYVKRYFRLRINKQVKDCLFYQMRAREGIQPPSEGYYASIAQGYKDFGLDLAALDQALQEAWGNKEITPALYDRYVRKGAPTLARAEPQGSSK